MSKSFWDFFRDKKTIPPKPISNPKSHNPRKTTQTPKGGRKPHNGGNR